jgi:hypothetical protein
MSKTIVHKHNYREILPCSTIPFSVLVEKIKQFGGEVWQMEERRLGIGDGYKQLNVFYLEDLPKVCDALIAHLRRLDKGRNYIDRWEALQSELSRRITPKAQNVDDMSLDEPLLFRTSEHLPSGILLPHKGASVQLKSLSKGALSCFITLDRPTPSEIESFKDEVLLTIFVEQNIPFLLFTFDSMYFETAIFHTQLVCEHAMAFMHFVDSAESRIVAQSSIAIPKEFMDYACRSLTKVSMCDTKHLDQIAVEIRSKYTFGQMVERGISVKLKSAAT